MKILLEKMLILYLAILRDYKKLNPILKNYDAVIWLAALVGDGACAINPTSNT